MTVTRLMMLIFVVRLYLTQVASKTKNATLQFTEDGKPSKK